MQKPKRPEKTAEEKAIETRQSMLLDEEIAESEEKLKAIAKGKLGRKSLLKGAPTTRGKAATRGGVPILNFSSTGNRQSVATGGGAINRVGAKEN